MIKSLPTDKVCEVFYLLSGKEGDFSLLCATAADSILSRTKRKAAAQWLRPLCYAAGALAYYRYTLSALCDNTETYKAGDIQIKSNAKLIVSNAKQLLSDALLACSPVLQDDFCFKAV